MNILHFKFKNIKSLETWYSVTIDAEVESVFTALSYQNFITTDLECYCFLFYRLHDTDAVVLALKSEIKNLEMTIVELEQTNQVFKIKLLLEICLNIKNEEEQKLLI